MSREFWFRRLSLMSKLKRLVLTLSIDRSYFISNGIVKQVNLQYPNAHNNFELNLTSDTTIAIATSQLERSLLRYNFIEFTDLELHLHSKQPIDVLGFLVSVDRSTKGGEEKRHRGTTAYAQNNSCRFKDDYLRFYFTTDIHQVISIHYFESMTLLQLTKGELSDFKSTYYTIQAKVISMAGDHDPWYYGCNTCNKKAIGTASQLRCPACGIAHNQFTPRYNFKLVVDDGTRQATITVFEAAEKIIGYPAKDFITMPNMVH